MAHSLDTDILGLIDRAARPSGPRAASEQLGAAFRELIGSPAGSPAPDADDEVFTGPGRLPNPQNLKPAPAQDDSQFAAIRLHGLNLAAEYPHTFTTTPETSDAAIDAFTANPAEQMSATSPSPEASMPATVITEDPDADETREIADKVPEGASMNIDVIAAHAVPDAPPEAAASAMPDQKANPVAVSGNAGEAPPRTDPTISISAAPAVTISTTDADVSRSRQASDGKSARTAMEAETEAKIAPSTGGTKSREEGGAQSLATLSKLPDPQEATMPDRGGSTPYPVRSESDDAGSENRPRADNTQLISPRTPPLEPAGLAPQSEAATTKSEPLFAATTPVANGPAPAANAGPGLSMPGMQVHAPMVATPAEVVDIIQSKVAGNEGSERITVQLDPPELGRVSIDFKFDAQGLQHVTVTGDTPEALKQLRQLHFQLTQALEQNGLTAQDMSFRQNNSRQGQPQTSSPFSGPLSLNEDDITAQIISVASAQSRFSSAGAGLDIKL